MKPKKIIFVLVLLGLATIVAIALIKRRENARAQARQLTLYGNVEIRQVALPFNNTERIAAVLVEEGDHVKRGQVLARLETARLTPLLAQAQAQRDAQRETVARLKNGARPEEIAQAKSSLAAAQAEAADQLRRAQRAQALSETSGISRQDVESAAAAAEVAQARASVAQKALDLLVAGPRAEDIAQAEAQLQGAAAQVALLQQQLADAELRAPSDAVVRTRILEPGEMASPQRPVFTLALTQPKWIRTYIGEPDLGQVREGRAASVTTDSFPGRSITAHVSYISSVAEFTPKTLETQELRTSLVYEVRLLVDDPADDLRLGMPVTVHLPRSDSSANAGAAASVPR